MTDLDNATKEVGRYHLGFGWKGKNSGHIITAERLENGSLKIYDPQSGKSNIWTKEYMSRIGLSKSGIEILRVDNLLVNTDIIDGVVIKSPKK